MSVGKASIKRAANAGTKKTAAEATAEVKAPETVKADAVKASAKKTASKTTAAKPAAAKKTTARKTTAKAAKSVKTSVLTPSDSEALQAAFLSDKAKQTENVHTPVHVTEELPIYLL